MKTFDMPLYQNDNCNFLFVQTSSNGTGMPLWRLSKTFYEFNSAHAFALFVFVMRYRLKQQESAAHDAITLLNPGNVCNLQVTLNICRFY